jgi:hypothetical protein
LIVDGKMLVLGLSFVLVPSEKSRRMLVGRLHRTAKLSIQEL